MKIAYIICPNGLGHLRRSITIINNISRLKVIDITIFMHPNSYGNDLIESLLRKNKIKIIKMELPHPVYTKNKVNYFSTLTQQPLNA